MTDTNRSTPKKGPFGSGAQKSSAKRRISRDQAETLLLGELRRLMARPIEEFARHYLSRVDAIALDLVGKVLDGDPRATELVLTIVNSLSRPGSVAARQGSEKDSARQSQKLSDDAVCLARKKWMN